MITASIVLGCYLLTGLVVAGGSNAVFIKGGFNKLCFSLKETALITVAWPYYLFEVLIERD
jgi:hypothetical protein